MTTRTRLVAGLNSLIQRGGRPIMFQYYSSVIGSVWDDDVTLSQSGADLWTSGIVLPLNNSRGSEDGFLVEQGKIRNDDIKLFTRGDLLFTGSELQVRIQLGSAQPEHYSLIGGVTRTEVGGGPVYKRAFIRRITTPGSLV